VVQTRAQQIQDGGLPTSWKIKKSRYLCNGLTDFDEILYGDAAPPSAHRQPIKKSKMADCHHLEYRKTAISR